MAALAGLLGPKLLQPGGAEVDTASLQGAVVALYFSAHWCPPCRGFTPQFKKVYQRCKDQQKSFDVVFVSSDQDEAGFREYFGTMPWHALPFAQRGLKEVLSSRFGVRGIPSVVLLSASGSIIEASARGKVMDPSFPSTLPSVLEAAAAKIVLPEGPISVTIRHQREDHEFEVIPEEGWELLRMQIFSATGVAAEQQRLFGLGRQKGALYEDMPLTQALAGGILAQKGSGYPLANVAATARSASGTKSDSLPGEGNHQGTLESGIGWVGKPAADDPEGWYQMDLGDTRPVAGVVIAPRPTPSGFVKKFKVSYADEESGPWAFVGDGVEFDGLRSNTDPPLRVPFVEPIAARFVRIHITDCTSRALRADLLLVGEDETPDKPPVVVVLGNFSQDDPFEVTGQPQVTENDKFVQEQHLAFLQAKISSAPGRLQHQVGSLQHVFTYEELALQRQALDQIPVCALAEAAAAETESYELAFMRKLLHWFKHEFFSWTNAPKCETCGSTDTKTVGATKPDQFEQAYGAGTVEVALCNTCGSQTRFPRYNHPGKLLETRQGRCGEWANCFTLVCRALGYEARHVHDWTDHVWTEIYSDSEGRWLHVDSCEAALDCPLVYEQGWGKQLTYCLAFGRDNVVDVTKRYTKKYTEVLTRRGQFPEDALKRVMSALDEFALGHGVAKFDASTAEARRAALGQRAGKEQKEFADSTAASELKAGEQVGRTSGDKDWREQRGELGANAEAKAKALACSDSGVANLGDSSSASAAPADTPDGPGWQEHRLSSVNSAMMSDDYQVHSSITLPDAVQQVRVSCRWKDQGFGNQKGQLCLVLRRAGSELCRKDCFGMAGHGWETKCKTFAASELASPASGDVLTVMYKVGGGGGHQLMVEDLKLAVQRQEAPMPASADAGVGCATPAASPSPAAATNAGEEACPLPAAPETPSRPQSASKKEEMQALVKKAFAELVASGVSPNEAALQAMERAKQMMAAPAPASAPPS